MLGRIFICFIFSLFPTLVFAKVEGKSQEVKEEVKVVQPKVLKSVNSEVEECIVYQTKLTEEDRKYIKFFTTYAYPKDMRQDAVLLLSFIIHSLAGISNDDDEISSFSPLAIKTGEEFYSYKQVPGSDTLWWIDIRDFNWTPDAWEIVANADGYIVEPVVNHSNNGALRLLGGNALLRADWFIEWAINPMRQLDRGDKVILYDTLLYAKNKIPQNIDEFRAIWGLPSLDEARKLGNEYLTLVGKSKQVARHNRILAGYRTQIGYFYESYDVTHDEGYRNYAEASLSDKGFIGKPPRVSDAGEAFSTNTVGMQVYALRDAQGKIIYDANAAVARHISDVTGDVRVRTGISCMDCHSSGPLPSENSIAEFFSRDKAKAYIYDIDDYRRYKRAFLDGRFEDSIKANQEYFKENLVKINGLTPEQNGANFLKLSRWYNNALNIEQAAFECGVDVSTFIEKCEKGYFGASLKMLIVSNEPISRTFWESKGKDGIPGGFQQAMVLINGVTQIETIYEGKLSYKVIEETPLLKGTNIVRPLKIGELLEPIDSNPFYYKVRVNNEIGWVDKKKVEDFYQK